MTEDTLNDLRHALNHLYEPRVLRTSPLLEALELAYARNAATQLRQRLIQSIEALEPDTLHAEGCPTWRRYEILLYRYVHQLSQKEVADQLGISVRHLRREQRGAIEVLGERLFGEIVFQPPDETQSASAASGSDNQEIASNLAWLQSAHPDEPADLSAALRAAAELTAPLAQAHGADVRIDLPGDLPALAVHPVALRQSLVSLLSLCIRRGAGCVQVQARRSGWDIEVSMRTRGVPRGADGSRDGTRGALEMLTRLARLAGGSLCLQSDDDATEAALRFPAAGQVPILAIDDNSDTLLLYERYAAGTRYRLLKATSPQQAFSIAEEHSPRAILVDVMMPDLDGWELMHRLRRHPTAAGARIAVCTILPERDLALSLGADAFMQKPVDRERFLDLLGELIA
jgi:CheY-like chemotaxis protein